MKNTTLIAVLACANTSYAALYINQSRNDAGNGPVSTLNEEVSNASQYLAYTENGGVSAGALQTFTGISFAEGNISGSYDVGVAYNWSTVSTRRSIYRAGMDAVYSTAGNQFHETFLGMFGANGESMTLTLSGLPVSSEFVLTTYHFDPEGRTTDFTTDLTGTDTFTSGGGDNATFVDPTPYIYEFELSSDASGEAEISFTATSTNMFAMNGFDLEAVPEPSAACLLALGGVALVVRRKRA